LRRKLAAFNDVRIAGEAENGLEALEKIERLRPDAVFLDIEMPELDGLGVARSLPQPRPRIVFVTAYDEFAVKAFEAEAADYLVKPVSEARLRKTIDRLRVPDPGKPWDRLPPSRIAIKSGNRYLVIDPASVSAILSRDRYAAILVDGRELLLEESLDDAAARLAGVPWLRVHRGGIVNTHRIAELLHEGDRKYTAILNDPAKTRVPVSRERLDEVRRTLGF
jgi:DNA-binding LytR/AlgR family response regulator